MLKSILLLYYYRNEYSNQVEFNVLDKENNVFFKSDKADNKSKPYL